MEKLNIFFRLLITLLCLTGCFDNTLTAPDEVVGETLGCKTQGSDLFCLTRYAGAGIQREPPEPLPPLPQRVYTCEIDSASQVYDGDTISKVRIHIAEVTVLTLQELGEVFPGILLADDGVYIQNGIRIAGIDTPEMRPSTKKRDGTPRSEQSRANEKKAAIAARDAVRSLISESGMQFRIQNVDIDKYGRVLADVFVDGIDVAEYLIENRHALPYDGGTKPEPDWDVLSEGLIF